VSELGPCFEIAHLGHVEMFTDRFGESLAFFTDVYRLTLTAQDAGSAYLRAWDDYEFHTLKLTRHTTSWPGRIAYRASSPTALARRVAVIEASGYAVHGWTMGDLGHRRAFGSKDPFGPVFEIYGDTHRCVAPPVGRSALKNLAQLYHGGGPRAAAARSFEPAGD
jgi:catechol 2,3-dioxygenase